MTDPRHSLHFFTGRPYIETPLIKCTRMRASIEDKILFMLAPGPPSWLIVLLNRQSWRRARSECGLLRVVCVCMLAARSKTRNKIYDPQNQSMTRPYITYSRTILLPIQVSLDWTDIRPMAEWTLLNLYWYDSPVPAHAYVVHTYSLSQRLTAELLS